jgi:hypothetical protein
VIVVKIKVKVMIVIVAKIMVVTVAEIMHEETRPVEWDVTSGTIVSAERGVAAPQVAGISRCLVMHRTAAQYNGRDYPSDQGENHAPHSETSTTKCNKAKRLCSLL